MGSNQTHPLYSSDREIVDSLIIKKSPQDKDLVDLARLFNRYDNFPGSLDIKSDLNKTLKFWGLDRIELNNLTRIIWSKGFSPSKSNQDLIGSSFDTSDKDNQ
tara:strand:+ start:3677 stop:3985 length:309 start_codon:yes stop_codon:yes gene_type:complete